MDRKSPRKLKGLCYLPGKHEDYICSLQKILNFINQETPEKNVFTSWIMKTFRSKNTNCTMKYLYLLKNTGQVSEIDGKLALTSSGKLFLENYDKLLVYDALNDHYNGIEEVMQLLFKQPLSLDEIAEALRKQGLSMIKNTQFKIRLAWLQSLGYVIKVGPIYMLNKEKIPFLERLNKSKAFTNIS